MALEIPTVLDESSLAELRQIRDQLDELEATTIALLINKGISWERLAGSLGVRRQSLHYRTARRASDLVEKWTRGPEKEINLRNDWAELLPLLRGRLEYLASSPARADS